MDLRRFLDLYVSESREHVQLLQRSLLAMEKDPTGAGVDEAFRAAHTLKGLSAAMGYRAVTGHAHLLEDRLEEIRAGRLVTNAALIDEMLAAADVLEAAIAEAVTTPPTAATDGADADTIAGADATAGAAAPAATAGNDAPAAGPRAAAAAARAAPSAGDPTDPPAPDGTATVAHVRLRADAPIKAARAMIIVRSLQARPGVLGVRPAVFDDDFAGDFRVFFDAGADLGAAEADIVAAGEVESVEFAVPAAGQASPQPSQQPSPTAAPIPQTVSGPAAPAMAGPARERQLRVDADRLDGIAERIGELSILFGRLEPAPAGADGGEDTLGRMGSLLGSLQRDILQLRMVPVREAFDRLPRVVRDAARTVGREVDFVVVGDDVELDRTIIDAIADPLVHLLRNSVDHGIEAPEDRLQAGKPARGRITLTAERERNGVRITVADDGSGVPVDRVIARARAAGLLPAAEPAGGAAAAELDSGELFRLLSHPGLSTAEQVSAVSGRGVGMDVVVSRIRALGGAIDMQTERGAGTTFSIRLPVTLALAQALRVRIGDEQYAIPLTHIAEAVDLNGSVTRDGAGLRLRDERIPLVLLRRVLQVAGAGREETAVIAVRGEQRAALAVDELMGREQILVKRFDAVAGTLPYFSGATMLADGRPVLVLDPLSVI